MAQITQKEIGNKGVRKISTPVSILTTLVAVTLLVPIASIALNKPLTNFVSLACVSCSLIWHLAYNRHAVINYTEIIVCFAAALVLAVHLNRGLGFVVTTGGLNVVLLIIVFNLFLQKLNAGDIRLLQKNLRLIFTVLGSLVIFEVLILVLDGGTQLREWLSSPTLKYKTHNSADILNWILQADPKVPGPNSIFIGSQMAPTIVLINAFLFRHKPAFCISFSIVFGLITTVTTAIMAICLVVFSLIKHKKRNYVPAVAIIFVVVTSLLITSDIFAGRIFNNSVAVSIDKLNQYQGYRNIDEAFFTMSGLEYNIWSFTSPVVNLLEQNWVSILFGSSLDFRHENLTSSDFGYAYDVFFLCGFAWFLILTTYLALRILLPFFTYMRVTSAEWSTQFCDALGLTLVLALSMLHYNHVMQNVPITILFSLGIAICIRLRKLYSTQLICQ